MHVLAVAWSQSIEKKVKVHLIDAFPGPVFVATEAKKCFAVPLPPFLALPW